MKRGPFEAGERILLIDAKDRRHLVTLSVGGRFHTHAGIVDHDGLIGAPEGVTISASTGRRLIALRPSLTDVVLKMPRGAQVIYPKDLGAIVVMADIFPGVRVLEAGIGSGALSMALLRGGASVLGYEIREDFAERAQLNVAAYLGDDVDYSIEIRDVYDGIDETNLDRIVLDLPEPWRVVEHAVHALRTGGIFCAYLPTINQTAKLRETLAAGPFGMAETVEILRRTWHIEERSVRPDHRMVAHTGFLTIARHLVPAPVVQESEEESAALDEDALAGTLF